MDITIHATLLPHDDPDASVAFYRDTLGFEDHGRPPGPSINLATKDLDGTFERLQGGEAEVVQEPIDQPYGIRDCSFRDPSGNLIRIQGLR